MRIVLADDHGIVRRGLKALLDTEDDIEVVGEALNGDEAIALAETLKPNVILMDIAMPGTNGLEATRLIKARFPAIQVLVLTMHRSEEYFFEILKTGASGYILKAAETNDLITAIRAVFRGEVFLYPTMAKQLLSEYLKHLGEGEKSDQPTLTPREKEVLRLLAEGYSNGEIAKRLVVSLSTVHSHHTNIMRKLNLSSRHELILYARQNGLVLDS